MLDYLRNLTKSDEEKRQEMMTAYLDGALTPKQQQQVESELAQDEGLSAELDQIRLLQQEMRQLPRRQVRRNFTLDPALYGRPQREPLVQAYPVLRTATVMAAFLFIFVLAANVFLGGVGGVMSSAEPAMMEAPSHEQAIAETAVEEIEANAPLIEAAPMEEAAEAPPILEEVVVDSEFEIVEDEAETTFEQRDMEAAAAVPLDGAAFPQKQEADGAAEDSPMTVMPTMVAEEAVGAGQIVEEATEAPAAAIEPAELPLASSPGRLVDEQGAAGEMSEVQTVDEDSLIEVNSLSMIALLLGIAFVVLVILTLLARRRFH